VTEAPGKTKAFAWALYDWANSGFPTVVSTFVIAAYFTQGIAPDPVTGQAQWGWMQTLAAFAIALLSPVLGAIADQGRRRRAIAADRKLHGADLVRPA
jgi:UMF1 family MFS transporter